MFNWFWEFVYDLLYAVFYLIDFIVDAFRLLSGLTDVTITEDGTTVTTNIVSYFITSHSVRLAFALVASISLVLLVVFTAFAIIRKQYMEEKEQRSLGAIVGQALKTFFIFMLVPAFMTVASYAVIVIMQQLELATNPLVEEIIMDAGGTDTASVTGEGYSSYNLNIAGILLYIIGNDCIKSGQELKAYGLLTADEISALSYSNVKNIFNIKKLNYFLGFLAGVIIFILFIKSLFMFVERLFNIIGLYVMSPVVASSAVLDGGSRFKAWRDQIISQFLVAFSVIIGMNIYFLIIPIVVNNITFMSNSFSNWLIRLFFIVGGAFAVNKLTTLFGNLVNQGAGTEAQATSDGFGRGLWNAAKGTARVAGNVLGKGWDAFKDATGYTTPRERLKASGDAKRKAAADMRDSKIADKWKENYYKKHPDEKAAADKKEAESPMGQMRDAVNRIAETLGANKPKDDNQNPYSQSQSDTRDTPENDTMHQAAHEATSEPQAGSNTTGMTPSSSSNNNNNNNK